MHGLHHTTEEFQAKLDTSRQKCTATNQDLPTSTVAQSFLPHKGLHRTPEERAAKMQAVLGGMSSATANHTKDDNEWQSNTVRSQGPTGGFNYSGILDGDQSQESSAIVADFNQDSNSSDVWLTPQGELPAAGQYLL
jgi:hypothetical protein